ncbi:MAG: DUF6252 family protein, partial [Cryomorphaceae bacterium]
ASAQPAIDAIMITAMKSATSAEAITITVADDITPGSYSIGSPTTLIMQYTNAQFITHLGTSGTMVVESHDLNEKILTGTFEFNAVQDVFQSTPDHVITEGSMTINY